MNELGKSQRSLLEEISIKSLGVIDRAEIEFKQGLNVITGETGAGKTMLLTALALVLGAKSDSDLIRNSAERLSVQGRFRMPNEPSATLAALLSEHEPEIEENSILLSRTVSIDGKSRAQLCGVSTTASVLASFGAELIEIHGQHGTLSLLKGSRQRELLDLFGGDQIAESLQTFQSALSKYKETRRRHEDLRRALKDRESQVSVLKELVNNFEKLKPVSGELDEIDANISRLESVEDLRIASSAAAMAISDDEAGVTTALSTAARSMSQARGKDSTLDELANRVEEIAILIGDLAVDLSSYLEGLEADPSMLERLLERRAGLLNFARKFGKGSERNELYETSISEALSAAERIEDLSGGEERLLQIQSEVDTAFDLVRKADGELTKRRIEFAKALSSQVLAELQDLSMPNANFEIRVNSSSIINENVSIQGSAEVEMLFAAHSGGTLLSISKAASGGELSRLMLAIEVVISKYSQIGTFLFDEIDAGIGGKAALEVGKRLKKLAEQAQVIVVTHLPQVAIWGDHHLRVLKDEEGSITQSSVVCVTGPDREAEIARMLSGLEDSEHAQEHARELLDLGKA